MRSTMLRREFPKACTMHATEKLPKQEGYPPNPLPKNLHCFALKGESDPIKRVLKRASLYNSNKLLNYQQTSWSAQLSILILTHQAETPDSEAGSDPLQIGNRRNATLLGGGRWRFCLQKRPEGADRQREGEPLFSLRKGASPPCA